MWKAGFWRKRVWKLKQGKSEQGGSLKGLCRIFGSFRSPGLWCSQNQRPSGLLQLFTGGNTRFVHLDREGFGNGSTSQKLDSIIAAMHQANRTQGGFIDGGTSLEALFKSIEIDHGVNRLEITVIEPPLGKATDERHLTALESETETATRTGALTFVPAARGLSVAAAFTDTETLTAVLGTWTRSEIMKSHE